MRVKLLVPLLLLISIPWAVAQGAPPGPSTTDAPSSTAEVKTNPPTDPPSTSPAPPPPPPVIQVKQYDFQGPVHELHGSYLLKARTHDTGRPGWASVWPVGMEEMKFGVHFWPPKYCHAIYICPVTTRNYGAGERFSEFSCDIEYIKFYPHIQKLFYKNSPTEEFAYYVEPSIQFQRVGDQSKLEFSLRTLTANPVDHEDWLGMKSSKDPSKFKDVTWDLKGKDLLILTNSRMCEVHKPGSDFYPIFDGTDSTQQPTTVTDNWPQWLLSQDAKQSYVPTVDLPHTGDSQKTVDLLTYLKDLKYENGTLGKVAQRCPNFEKVGVFAARKPVFERSMHVSTASLQVLKPNLQTPTAWTFRIEFSMNNCKWIRFWATDDKMEDYKTKMKIEDTLDLFIQEGFMIPPDTDTPIALPDIQVMDRMKITILRGNGPKAQGQGTDDHELIEFAFGSVNDRYLFRQFFKSKAFGKANTNIHMIRSPKCETNLVTEGGFVDHKTSTPVINMKDVMLCTYSYLKDEEEVKRIEAAMNQARTG